MKAREYFKKYDEAIVEEIRAHDGENKVLANLLTELLDEGLKICEQRKVVLDSSALSVMKEQNSKWNALCRLFEDKYKQEVLKENGFIKWLNYEMAKEQNGDSTT